MIQGTLTKDGVFTLTKKNEIISLFPGLQDLELPENSIYMPRKTKKGGTILYLSEDKTLLLGGKEFYFWGSFPEGHLFRIELTPYVKNAPDWPNPEYENEKYQISTRILQKILGDPDEKADTRMTYYYSWGRIFTDRILNGKSPYTGGNINIIYK